MTDATVVAAAVASAKAMLRLQGTGEDAVLTRLVRAGFAMGEAWCGQAFVSRTVVETVRGTGGWQALVARPVTAITGVAASGGGALAVDAYAIDVIEGIGRVRLPQELAALVTAEAGLAARWNALPAGIAHGVVLMAVHLFENRTADGAIPAAVAALWRPYRVLRMGA